MAHRLPAVANIFYPAELNALKELLTTLEKTAPHKHVPGALRAGVMPHAGLIYSGRTAMTLAHVLKDHEEEYDHIILIGPSHHIPFTGIVTYPPGEWEMPFGSVTITPHPAFPQAEEPFIPEHSLEVILPFLWWKDLLHKRISMLLTSMSNPADIAPHLWLPGSILIVSTDLSHYYPERIARAIDRAALECIPRNDLACVSERVEACGKDALISMLLVAQREHWNGVFLDYTTSADTVGTSESVVGYAAFAFTA